MHICIKQLKEVEHTSIDGQATFRWTAFPTVLTPWWGLVKHALLSIAFSINTFQKFDPKRIPFTSANGSVLTRIPSANMHFGILELNKPTLVPTYNNMHNAIKTTIVI